MKDVLNQELQTGDVIGIANSNSIYFGYFLKETPVSTQFYTLSCVWSSVQSKVERVKQTKKKMKIDYVNSSYEGLRFVKIPIELLDKDRLKNYNIIHAYLNEG